MRKILLIISITIFTLTVKAQKKIIFGVKGGINITNMTSDYFTENNSKTEFHIGLLSEISIGNKFSVQPEILYSKQGTNASVITYGGGGGLHVTEFSLDYIQIPILAKIYIYKNLSIEIGPSFNFLIHDEAVGPKLPDLIIGDEVVPQERYQDSIGDRFEFSGVLGLSYKIKGGIFGSLRYVNGLSVALDRDYHDEDAKNFGFQLGIGFLF